MRKGLLGLGIVGSLLGVLWLVKPASAPTPTPTPNDQLSLEPLEVSPDVINPGTRVTISGIIANIGNTQTTYFMQCYVEGVMIGGHAGAIKPGGIRTNHYTFYPEVVGSYLVEILVGELRVTDTIEVVPSTEPPPEEPTPVPREPDLQIPTRITALDIRAGQRMYATILLQNVGVIDGAWSIEWYLNDVFQKTDQGLLAPGAHRIVYLTPTISVRGHYDITAVITWGDYTVERFGSFEVF